MEMKAKADKIFNLLKKYRYAVLVLAIGLVLMMIPSVSRSEGKSEVAPVAELSEDENIEKKLSALLSKIDGAGETEVMLTTASGEETIYQSNTEMNDQETASSSNVDTVIITDADRNENGLIKQVNPPVYLGAIVVCKGADDPRVKLAIVDAVSKITGLGADRICVLKMQ